MAQYENGNWKELVGGYLIDQEDRAGLEATSTEPELLMAGELPEMVDPRNHPQAGEGFLKVEDQLQIGACQGNALTETGEYCYMLATGLVMQFSRMFAYIISQMVNNIRSDSGSTLDGGSKAAKETGFCPEANAPYPSRYPGWGWITDAMRKLAANFKLRTHTIIKTADGVRAFLGSGIGLVQIGISWNGSMEPDSHGCIRDWDGRGGGGHSVCFVGYVPDSVVGQKSSTGYWYLLKNSWGLRWGIKGYAYVDPRAVQKMLGHPHTVFIGRSDMETPRPRPLPIDFTKPGASRYA